MSICPKNKSYADPNQRRACDRKRNFKTGKIILCNSLSILSLFLNMETRRCYE